MRCRLMAIGLAAVSTACAGGLVPPAAAPAPQDYVVPVPIDRAWTSLLIVYTDLAIPIGEVIREDRFIRSAEMASSPPGSIATYVDCGTYDGDPIATQVTLYMRITTILRPVGTDSTAVRSNIAAHGRFENATEIYGCNTKGVMERRIADLIATRPPALGR